MRVPQRPSLVNVTAEAIREGIAAGEWPTRLPGERTLCEELQVSRSTLREALRLLERQQLITTAKGRPRRIKIATALHPVPGTKEIGLLTLQSVARQSPQTTYYLHELRARFQAAGFHLRVFRDQRLAGQDPRKFLESLLESNHIAAWLLLSLPAPVQRWFAHRGLPTLVIGFCHDSVTLPSFDVDLRAACRHAAGSLRAQGHERLALLRHPQKSAGMKVSEAGFLEGAIPPGQDPRLVQVLSHNATPAGIRHCLDRALASSRPPTALVVCDAAHALCAASHLLARKISIPGEISLISRDQDEALGFFSPEITRYTYRKQVFASRVARLAIQLASHGRIPLRDYRLMPQLLAGQTVGPPPRR